MASPQGIESILLNLALNAVDASRPGDSVTIVTRPARDGSAVEVTVVDTGIGIPSTDLERIFEPFFTTKVKPRGTGLGLAVCQSVVQAHGGEIRVASEPGAGSRFTVLLPVDGKGDR
jgi:two-component system sensor histidine kinase HydH